MTVEPPIDTKRVLLAADGLDYWRWRMHARCDPERGVRCPWCDELERQAKLNKPREGEG